MGVTTAINQGTSFPPLATVRATLRPRWYRSPIDPVRLRALSKRSDRQGWWQAGGHAGLFATTATLTLACWVAELWWAMLVALWCHGFVASFFSGTAPHELGHGTVFQSRRLNRVFLYVFSAISWWDPFDYAASHTYHHRYTTHPEADRENLLPLTPSLRPGLVVQLLTLNLFSRPGRNFSKGGFFSAVRLTVRAAFDRPVRAEEAPSQAWLAALHDDQPDLRRQSVLWSRTLLAVHGGVLVVSVLSGAWIVPLLLTTAAFTANIGSYLVGVTQHCGLMENSTDFRKNTRSIRINPGLAFLYWHMNWHTEHHMYANVPCYNLPALARELAEDMPEPRSLTGAWREMREIWQRQQTDPHYSFDTPVPPPRDAATAATRSDDFASLGDLAPDGLRTPE
ncbi:MAG: fatty acid desaturase [Pseudomonadota bacterium]